MFSLRACAISIRSNGSLWCVGNRIEIVQDDRGVHVTADGGPVQNFTGIQAITVQTGYGNDSVTFRTVSDPSERSGGVIDPNVRDVLLYANLGDGNDVFNGDLQSSPDPCQVMVIGGGGADSINALIGLLSNATPAGNAQGAIDLSLNGGDGNDNIQSAIRNVNLNGRVTVDLQGGAGNDIVQQTLEMVKVNARLDTTLVTSDIDSKGWTN